MKTALITGVAGQDGSYLAELLLEKGYIVHGLKRRSSSLNTSRIDHLYQDPHEPNARFFLHYGDMTDGQSLIWLLFRTQPDEIYNLAAQSHVAVSFETPEYTANADALGTLRLLEAMRITGSKARFYQASTSEMFGNAPPPQNELTPFRPRSPYAAAKLYAHSIAVNYREAYGMHISCGILFNHASPRQGETFLPRKVARGVAAIARGEQDCLYLGNLDAKRDWGHARDYVEGMWLMLQQQEPDDYVLAMGEAHSVGHFVVEAFGVAGIAVLLDPKERMGIQARIAGRDALGRRLVQPDDRYLRPTEVDFLLGDATKARAKLGWRPRTTFHELVHEMVEAEL